MFPSKNILIFRHFSLCFQIVSDVDECSSNVHDCSSVGDCTNTIGSFECSCKNGYSGDGVACSGKLI